MPVNYEIKGTLAKLLASENLIVENQKVSTASFNVQTRVLTLPMWERATNSVYDLLVAHEVGHALFTPDKDWKLDIPRDYLNITEDARIEKLMKRRYGGLYKTFYRGYQQLSDDDFFELEDTDVNQMSFGDRVNLHFKIGNFINIDFTEAEKEVVLMVENAETFDDAIAAAKAMWELAKIKMQQKKVEENQPESLNQSGTPGNSSIQSSDSNGDDESETDETGGESGGESGGEDSPVNSGGGSEDILTDDLFSEKVEELNRMSEYDWGNRYVEHPNLTESDYVAYSSEVTSIVTEHFSSFDSSAFEYVDSEYKKFLDSTRKEVNYLVKEFECKKAADSYARTTVSRTGVLDCSKLHTYKYNDDIFKKLNVVPDGKNHGLIFVLDWSGSMAEVMLDTVKQLINLIIFCRKVHIPFEVYGFTNSFAAQNYWQDYANGYVSEKFRPNQLYVDSFFKMLNFVSSKDKASDIDVCVKNLFRLAYNHNHSTEYCSPVQLQLSGTPLCEAIVSLHKIIPNFQKNHALQKVNVVVLTDGETAPIRCTIPSTKFTKDRGNGISIGHCGRGVYLRSRKTGEVRELGHWFTSLKILLEDLKQCYPSVNLIGIRLVNRREWSGFANLWVTENREKIDKEWKKTSSAVIRNSSFDAFFALACQSLNNDVEFDVQEDATKAQIRAAFKKSLQSKALNKKILSNFIEMVV